MLFFSVKYHDWIGHKNLWNPTSDMQSCYCNVFVNTDVTFFSHQNPISAWAIRQQIWPKISKVSSEIYSYAKSFHFVSWNLKFNCKVGRKCKKTLWNYQNNPTCKLTFDITHSVIILGHFYFCCAWDSTKWSPPLSFSTM